MRSIAQSEIDIPRIGAFGNPFLNYRETLILIALVRSVEPKVMIEFGCNAGRTARNVLDHIPSLEHYIGIDAPFSHMPTLAQQVSERVLCPGLFAYENPRFVLMIRERGSLDLTPQDLPPCDAAFIDADHSEQAVIHDSRLAFELVRPGGVIVWHDYGNQAVEVTQALDQLCNEGWPIEHVEESWIAFCRIA
jgi:predicted O-methyltransferase YrrM